jgi:hypothetical protein
VSIEIAACRGSKEPDNRRRQLLIGTAAMFACGVPNLVRASPVSIDYSQKIVPVDQGNSDLCWLAAAAMIQSYQANGAVTMADTANSLGPSYVSLFNSSANLPFSMTNDLASKLNMSAFGYQSFTTSWWSGKLQGGPMWVGGMDPGGKMGHVRVLAGMQGDTDTSSTLVVSYIDPAGGILYTNVAFTDFITFYEGLPSNNPAYVNQIFAF